MYFLVCFIRGPPVFSILGAELAEGSHGAYELVDGDARAGRGRDRHEDQEDGDEDEGGEGDGDGARVAAEEEGPATAAARERKQVATSRLAAPPRKDGIGAGGGECRWLPWSCAACGFENREYSSTRANISEPHSETPVL